MKKIGQVPVLAVSGVKNSGKTTLIERLLPILASRGLEVGVIKHDGHRFTPDTPGTDSFRFFEAGACASAVFDDEKFSVSVRKAFDIESVIALIGDVDLVLLEGFKNSEYPKIQLITEPCAEKPASISRESIAVICDYPIKAEVPIIGLNELESIADIIIRYVHEK